MIDLERIRTHELQTHPYRWGMIGELYAQEDAARLAASYPCDHFKLVAAHGGEKDYEYEARSLIAMNGHDVMHPDGLSPEWRLLALDLLSAEYRSAMATLTGCDLREAPLEANVFHYGPGASLGAHRDLPEKLVTHVLYFNTSWDHDDGGCLSVLRSENPVDVVASIPPLIGNSAIIVRSDNSWHAVPRIDSGSGQSRRSVTVTFYRSGSLSSMWPPDDPKPLHTYQPPERRPVKSAGSSSPLPAA